MGPYLRKYSTFSIVMQLNATAYAIRYDGFFTVTVALHHGDTKASNSAALPETRYMLVV